MAEPGKSLMIVEDDETFSRTLARSFRKRGYLVHTVRSIDQLQALLDDPDMAAREINGTPAGPQTVESAVGMIVLGDVLVHTWDLARATGLDETLDADIVTEMLIGMQPIDDMLRQSGHYGPKVAVDEDVDDQTKLIAFTGRTP